MERERGKAPLEFVVLRQMKAGYFLIKNGKMGA